jgi:hypothetical protein
VSPLPRRSLDDLLRALAEQDEQAIPLARRAIASGAPPLDALDMVSPLRRFDVACDLLPRDDLYRHIADLWRRSEPDDREPRFLRVWQAAHRHWLRAAPRERTYITDGHAIPVLSDRIRVYRGQEQPPPDGIAWSLMRVVAQEFAARIGGVVIEGLAPREAILAYLVGRFEHEVVLDPSRLISWHVPRAYDPQP